MNTTANGNQTEPSVSGLSDGRYVITWTDWSASGGDTIATAVRGQIFATDGTRLGSEFLVNTDTLGTQGQSSVTTLQSGSLVVTWSSYSGTRGVPM